jgi:hypothetical protein
MTRQIWNCVPEFLQKFPTDHLLLTDFDSDESPWPSMFDDYVEELRVYTQEVASARDISIANAVRATGSIASEVLLVPRPSLAAVPAMIQRMRARGTPEGATTTALGTEGGEWHDDDEYRYDSYSDRLTDEGGAVSRRSLPPTPSGFNFSPSSGTPAGSGGQAEKKEGAEKEEGAFAL